MSLMINLDDARQIDVRPADTLLKDLECPQCGETGFIIETGEDISDEGR